MKYVLLCLLAVLISAAYGQKSNPQEVFEKYEEKSINTDFLLSQVNGRTDDMVYLQLHTWNLELTPSNILAEDYKFIDQNGRALTSSEDRVIPLTGYTDQGGQASITIGKDFIFGYVQDGEEVFYIEPSRFYTPSRSPESFIIYNVNDVKETAPVKCGVQEVSEKTYKLKDQDHNSRSSGLCYDVEYAIVNDWSMFNKYGASGLESRNIAITNDVNTNYANAFSDEIRFIITGQWNATCSSCNPFGVSTNLNTTLDNFTSWGQSNLNNSSSSNYIRHDVASLWSDVFANSGTIGLAWVGVICNSHKYNVLSDFSSNANSLRVLTAHELGHNFAAGHDAAGSGHIMAPSVNNTSTWSSGSISSINNHLASRGCLETCSDLPATVYFDSGDATVLEDTGGGIGGSCQEHYKDYFVPITISKSPTSNVSVSFSTSGSTATNGYDYQLLTNSITFTSSGATTQNVTFRIYDDAIVENPENLRLSLSVSSGPGEASSNNAINIGITSNDVIESSAGYSDTVFYGNTTQSLSGAGFFEGSRTDVRSRFIILASELQSMGIAAGEIDMLAFYVYEKNSTGTFNNFRLGMTEITQNTLDGVGWLSTETVFSGNVQTTVSAWNAFEFTSGFEWDGTSNLYVEMCFDNSSAIGHDRIIWYNTGSGNNQMLSFSTNSLNNCGFVSNWSYYYDRAPVLLIRRKGSTEVEMLANESANGRIKVGETANLFSDNGRIIATIKNTGSSNLQCITSTIDQAGIGQSTLPFGSGMMTDKSFYIETSNSGTYDLTLYFTEQELAIWGSESLTLNFLKSNVPVSSSNSNNAEILNTASVNTNIGAENTIAYKTTSSGSSYYALTNGSSSPPVTANVASTWENADVLINEFGKGLLMKNSTGNQYVLTVNTNGDLIATMDNNVMSNSNFPEGDLCILTPGKSLMLKRTSSAYTGINVDNDGNIIATNTSNVPTQAITVESGHFGLLDVAGGVIFQNMQNECYKVYVDESGNLRTGMVSCP
ncbi:M12 family metallo-peptidase [Portibacter marinus]|uniref:M12 family metallo-peptidase n=1 Tax=Portibacter marinus TaxID=2898660 RepID=UPI001F44C36C|nr:M12 family metallo-peptidase [Portibacter marinus]